LKSIQQKGAIYAAHSNLDAAYGGVNFKMAEKLELQNIEWLSPKASYEYAGETRTAGEGIIASLSTPMSQKDFMERVKEIFGLRSLRVNHATKGQISRVALCGGSGAFLIPKAVEQGADAFLTGEIGYHRFFGYEDQLLLMEIGHYESEQYTLELLYQIISRKASGLQVCRTKLQTNPINYL
ncbi:MAG: Nif3-like dinuclear metal center hexameric protein, partial [Bacteroidaceae bacterium]|nr:Nif3-like dinuclear metal center hexameric protein [Bacteroidaceae bacterium]